MAVMPMPGIHTPSKMLYGAAKKNDLLLYCLHPKWHLNERLLWQIVFHIEQMQHFSSLESNEAS